MHCLFFNRSSKLSKHVTVHPWRRCHDVMQEYPLCTVARGAKGLFVGVKNSVLRLDPQRINVDSK